MSARLLLPPALLAVLGPGCRLVPRCEYQGTCVDVDAAPAVDCPAALRAQSEDFSVASRLADLDTMRHLPLRFPGGWLQVSPTGARSRWWNQHEGMLLYKDLPARCDFLVETRLRLGRSSGDLSAPPDGEWNGAGLLLRNQASSLGTSSWIKYDLGVHDVRGQLGRGLALTGGQSTSRYVSAAVSSGEARLRLCRVGPVITFYYHDGARWQGEAGGRLVAGDAAGLPEGPPPARATRPDLVEDDSLQAGLTVESGEEAQALGTFEYLCFLPVTSQEDCTKELPRPCSSP